MSSTPTLERAKAQILNALLPDVEESLASRSPLVQYRAIITARKALVNIESMLKAVEEGLTTAATEEWEHMRGRTDA
jgi:hypothetical protein